MAYRRRQGITRASTFKEEIYHNDTNDNDAAKSNSTSSSLAARAIRASAAHRDSSGYGYAYAGEAGDSSSPSSLFNRDPDPRSKGPDLFESASMEHPNESKYGFWGVLARKAKSILEEENENQDSEAPTRIRTHANNSSNKGQFYVPGQLPEGAGRIDNVSLKKGLDKITTSLNHIGDTIGNALEEGRTIVENKTADIIQETRKLQIGRKGTNPDLQYQGLGFQTSWQKPSIQPSQMPILSNQETQLKASRDVAMATAAKAKLLLRELKTVKADLAFAKERCAQLEEENKRLRESRGKGDNPADDDLIRLQLETLLAEKSRLAHENSIYARENRFLREIVEYHQLTMQDVVYFDEGTEEVTEVYPFSIDDARVLSTTPTSPTSPSSLLSDISLPSSLPETKELKSGLPRVPSKKQISSSSPGAPSETCPGSAPSRKEATEIPSMLQEPASVQEGSRPPETVLDDQERASYSSS